jgi:hypothetical protein
MQNLTAEIQVGINPSLANPPNPNSQPPTPNSQLLKEFPAHALPYVVRRRKVALELGYKNGGSLRARWNSLKRSKISASSPTSNSAAAPSGGVDKATPSKKGKATPKKAKAAEDGEGPKKGGKKGAKAKKVKTEEEDDAVKSVEGADGVAVAVAAADFMGEEDGE